LWISPESVVKDANNKITQLIDQAHQPIADNFLSITGREPEYVPGPLPSIKFPNTVVTGSASESFDLSTGLTIAFWIQRDMAMTIGTEVFTIRNINSGAWPFLSIRVAPESDGQQEFSAGIEQNSNYRAVSKVVWTTAWQHFTWVYDGNASVSDRVRFYVDGQPQTLSVLSTFPQTLSGLGTKPVYIGGENAIDSGAAVAQLGEFVVYRRGLTPSEIQRVFRHNQRTN